MNEKTQKVIKTIKDNKCIFCGKPTNEDLRKWFGKGGAGGATKARKLGKKGIASFVNRKRKAQKKGGDPKKGGERSKGQKTIKVKTGT